MTRAPDGDEALIAVVTEALNIQKAGPKSLEPAITWLAQNMGLSLPSDPMDRIATMLRAQGPNDPVRLALLSRIQSWDHEQEPLWAPNTLPHSDGRRSIILQALGFGPDTATAVNDAIPLFSVSDVPIVIAETHEPWYEERKREIRDFYWDHYIAQLSRPSGNWDIEAIARLDLSTDDVISRLSDPLRREIYQTKGLVMGYVQSGKTSHFGGLIAKAADAGYRLIIVLAGLTDILRQQTQRRLDKEIVGRELLPSDEYASDKDWPRFVSHRGRPSELGHPDFERLTSHTGDYSSLRQLAQFLEFKRADKTKPFNAPMNLRAANVRLAVLKKLPNRIDKLCSDLRRLKDLQTQLESVPTLIIDDESDQASINVMKKAVDGKKKTNTTNAAIRGLLELLPRAQYVGYTATPFANVFIDPSDAADLFPKDFLVSLPRPTGYMGVADFYDFDRVFGRSDYRSNEQAYVRDVVGDDELSNNLPKAIDSYVLAGAIKLYRESREPGRYSFRHHTMLVHHSAKQVVHDEDKRRVSELFGMGRRYMKSEGLASLKKLYDEDFRLVTSARAPHDVTPSTFDDLLPFITECVSRLQNEPVRIVNGGRLDDTPDFDQGSVWAILVGGTKLARGYTVEGLTISYYRRPTGAGDTLMQMGRWFGFRPGYSDLVRLFIGSAEKRGKTTINLYEAFGAVCRDEEALRLELEKYAKDGLKPIQVPPLVLQHLPSLPPTSRNKMFNAVIAQRDFSGEWTEKTSAPTNLIDKEANRRSTGRLLNHAINHGEVRCGLDHPDGYRIDFHAYAFTALAEHLLTFLREYRWSGDKSPASLETQFLERSISAGILESCVVVAPQAKTGKTIVLPGSPVPDLAVSKRARVSETRFGVYSDPKHRYVAGFLAGVDVGSNPTNFLQTARSGLSAVLLIYPVAESLSCDAGEVSIGFGVQFPGAKNTRAIVWSVEDPSNSDEVVVSRRQETTAARRRKGRNPTK